MKHKDTLTLYEELVASGISDTQAKIQAHQLGGVTDCLEEIKKDMWWMRAIGAAMTVAFFSNGFFMWLNK
jgi:hypothetical protein